MVEMLLLLEQQVGQAVALPEVEPLVLLHLQDKETQAA
jgi:hypothetical protein